MKLFFLIIFILWVWSYFKFRKAFKYDSMLCDFLKYKYKQNPTPQSKCEYASALMLCQQYASAVFLFRELQSSPFIRANPYITDNIAFCEKPFPWSDGPAKNHIGGSWLTNFLLLRFGRKRAVTISDDSQLEFSSYLRMVNRKF